MKNFKAERKTHTELNKFKFVPDPSILFKRLEKKDKSTTEATGKKRSYCWKRPQSSRISKNAFIQKYSQKF